MRKKLVTATIALVCAVTATAADNVKATIHADQPGAKINREIYGQFSEHLGSCIYGGLWVGENSQIPNINGYRKDVFEALKALKVPVLRWPGGCFADDYHWMDGIGPKNQRPSLRNNNWGGTIEDNSFGTHEFLNLCEMLGCEPYISGNVGSGTVKEMAQWVEYMTSDGDTPMARLRRANGRDKAWKVKYFGIGNEAWGCGGNMTPEYYSDEFRKFNTYLRDYTGNKLYRIGSGASDYDYNWTTVLMDTLGSGADKVSVNSGAIRNPSLVGEAAKLYGDQCVVLSADVKRVDGVFRVFAKGGRENTGMEAVEWIRRCVDSGAGEVVLNSIDTDGVKNGFDLEMLDAVCRAVSVPVIASGGAGCIEDFIRLFKTLPGADAGLAASIFHFGEVKISDLKQRMREEGIPARI